MLDHISTPALARLEAAQKRVAEAKADAKAVLRTCALDLSGLVATAKLERGKVIGALALAAEQCGLNAALGTGAVLSLIKDCLEDPNALDRELAKYPLTDLGNAERFVARQRDNFLWCPAIGWLAWDGKRYARDAAGGLLLLAVHQVVYAIEREARSIAGTNADFLTPKKVNGKEQWYSESVLAHAKNSQSAGRLNCIACQSRDPNNAGHAAPYLAVPPDALDADPLKINVLNGTLVCSREGSGGSGELIVLKPHSQADRITKLAPAVYDPKAECPQYDDFLAQVQPQPGMRRSIHQWGGLSLTGDASEQKFHIWYGRGGNGKGTVLELWASIAGDYAGSVAIETFLDQSRGRRGGDATPDLAKLPGVRMLRTSEPERGAKLAEAFIKLVTGGDPIDARHLNREFFTFKPQFKLTISGNHKPVITGGDEGIWRRLIQVPWGIIIPKDKQDAALPERLKPESSGVLNRLLDGLRDWLENGLVLAEEIQAATAEYRSDSDLVGRFMAACTEHEPGSRVQSTQLYEVFSAWLIASGEMGKQPWSNKGFSEALADRGYLKIKSEVMWWLDLRLKKAKGDFIDIEGKPLAARWRERVVPNEGGEE